ncbi:hypothetical protein ACFW1A_23050 [Kitasatospora sp. NPDC058965]|uniref:hypothetical protein n=1 Tax=Kitasatospora sp. NPDC058965 TaxID=3346682 RepID=UPI0036A1BF2B
MSSAIRAAIAVSVVILNVWIVLDLTRANTGIAVVHWVEQAANWLAGWSRGIFTTHNRISQVLLDYGVAVVAYLLAGSVVRRGSKS